MREAKEIKPSTPEAFRNGCGGCKGDKHQEGCVLWQGDKATSKAAMMAASSSGASGPPKGITWTQTTIGALNRGDIWIDDYTHKNNVGTNGWPVSGLGDGIFSLFIRDSNPLGSGWSSTLTVWKAEMVY